MNRRAVREIGSSFSLSNWLKTFGDLPCPWDTAALFGNDGPLEIGLGSGKGLFISGAAATYPGVNFLGLEISLKYAKIAAERLAQRDLPNARLMHGDGLQVFRELLPDACLQAVHVYFPDPWWKARHKKRRVLNAAFLAGVQRTLKPGGKLHFWTDVEEYYQTTLQLIAERTQLIGPLAVDEQPSLHDLDFRTHFERRTRQAGLPVYRAEFQRAE